MGKQHIKERRDHGEKIDGRYLLQTNADYIRLQNRDESCSIDLIGVGPAGTGVTRHFVLEADGHVSVDIAFYYQLMRVGEFERFEFKCLDQ